MLNQNLNLRDFSLSNKFLSREPSYQESFKRKVTKKYYNKVEVNKSAYDGRHYITPIYCKNCLYPFLSASPMEIDKKGICMGCRTAEIKNTYNKKEFDRREYLLKSIINKKIKSKNSEAYDCIVSVSGGKDSYYQTHFVTKVLKLRPLLVTYNGNNYSKIGMENLAKYEKSLRL